MILHPSKKLALLAFFILILSLAREVHAQPTSIGFESANKLYYEGKFPEAASAYETLIRSGQKTAILYFNLGNALFKSGQVGRAIAAYRQAEQITPRDPDVRANLHFARNQVQGPTLSSNRVEAWIGKLTLNEWAILATASLWLFFLLLILLQARPLLKPTLKFYILVSIFLTLFMGVCLAFSFYHQQMLKTAIVIAPDTVVREGPVETSRNAFPVHDGTEMRVLNEKEEWLQVSPDPSRVGWIRRDQVVL